MWMDCATHYTTLQPDNRGTRPEVASLFRDITLSMFFLHFITVIGENYSPHQLQYKPTKLSTDKYKLVTRWLPPLPPKSSFLPKHSESMKSWNESWISEFWPLTTFNLERWQANRYTLQSAADNSVKHHLHTGQLLFSFLFCSFGSRMMRYVFF